MHNVARCRNLGLVQGVILEAADNILMFHFLLEKLVLSAHGICRHVGTASLAFDLHLRLKSRLILNYAANILWCKRMMKWVIFSPTE